MRNCIAIFFIVLFPSLYGQNNSNSFSDNPKQVDLRKLHCETDFYFTPIDTWPTGVAWDGYYLWGGGSDGHYIYKYSSTGIPLDSIENPSHQNGTEGLVFDGSYLWALVEQEDVIFKIDMNTKHVVDHFNFDLSTDGFGLAIDNGDLLATDYTKGTLVRINKSNGQIIKTIQLEKEIMDICMINGMLYGLDYGYTHLYEINPKNGKILDSLAWCVGYPLGLAWDGNALWNVSSNKQYGGEQRIYRMKIDLGASNRNAILPVPVFLEVSVDSTHSVLTVDNRHTLIGAAYSIKNKTGVEVGKGILGEAESKLDISKLTDGTYTIEIGDFMRTFEIKR